MPLKELVDWEIGQNKLIFQACLGSSVSYTSALSSAHDHKVLGLSAP